MGRRLAPQFIAPMKALGTNSVPPGDWRLEIKFDGYRAIAVVAGKRIELWSRNHKSLAKDYPEIVAALKNLRSRNVVLDGEIVALDPSGRSHFQLLQRRSAAEARPPIVYYLFDLLQHDGESLLEAPIELRRARLEAVLGRRSREVLRLSPVFDTAPGTLLAEVRKRGLEGIVAKAAGSTYESDRRSGAWLKCRVTNEQEFVIGGFTAPKKSRTDFGALLVGYHEGTKLAYAGKVGTGFDRALLASLRERLEKKVTASCPFDNLPLTRRPRFGSGMTADAMRDVTWVRPDLVCQIRFAEWTRDGLLRHPVFLGLRPDKAARDVVREASRAGAS